MLSLLFMLITRSRLCWWRLLHACRTNVRNYWRFFFASAEHWNRKHHRHAMHETTNAKKYHRTQQKNRFQGNEMTEWICQLAMLKRIKYDQVISISSIVCRFFASRRHRFFSTPSNAFNGLKVAHVFFACVSSDNEIQETSESEKKKMKRKNKIGNRRWMSNGNKFQWAVDCSRSFAYIPFAYFRSLLLHFSFTFNWLTIWLCCLCLRVPAFLCRF